MTHRNYELLRGTHILVVDDDDFNLEFAKVVLDQVGANVSFASNGLDALRLLQLLEFDCVLMDYQMPVMNGIETTLSIRSDPKVSGMRVIACSSQASPTDRAKYLSAGMNDVVAKPYAAEQLLGSILGQLGYHNDRGG
jgi:CheY-like chemotaxis protein